jgi:hypothetical protein
MCCRLTDGVRNNRVPDAACECVTDGVEATPTAASRAGSNEEGRYGRIDMIWRG